MMQYQPLLHLLQLRLLQHLQHLQQIQHQLLLQPLVAAPVVVRAAVSS